MRVFLEPAESLLFRTGRPFDAGEVGYAETMFPPTPETLQGVVRSMLATHWDTSKSLPELFRPGSELVKLIGDRDGYGRFRITHISLGHRIEEDQEKERKEHIECLFPVPAHLLQDEKHEIYRLKPGKMDGVSSNIPPGMQYLIIEEDQKSDVNDQKSDVKAKPIAGWLTEDDLRKALSPDNSYKDIKVINAGKIYKHEPRVGIGMENATKTTSDGLLYSMQMIRMEKGYGFVVDIRITDDKNHAQYIDDKVTKQTLNLPKQGWVTMGGEQRAARFKVIDTPKQSSTSTDRNKDMLVYLATPAYFKEGWQPKDWLPRPTAAAISHYQSIGGWKLNAENGGGTNKSMQRFVPAGSVYFFDKPVKITQPLTDYGWQIGYGITYTGEW